MIRRDVAAVAEAKQGQAKARRKRKGWNGRPGAATTQGKSSSWKEGTCGGPAFAPGTSRPLMRIMVHVRLTGLAAHRKLSIRVHHLHMPMPGPRSDGIYKFFSSQNVHFITSTACLNAILI
ncbi:hypothetical protein SEVIR_5G406233v4 [Setaria viridis]